MGGGEVITRKSSLLTRDRAFADFGPIGRVTKHWQRCCWATGFQLDFGWVHVPVFDEAGAPLHQRGITSAPGFYFLGLPWLYKEKSALLFGIGEDAAFLASAIASR